MRLRGAVSDQASIAAFAIAGEVGGTLAGGQQGEERGAGRGVLNHAASGAGRKKLLRQAEHGDKPIEHVRFQFGARRTGGPEHALHAESGGKEIAENGRPRGVCRKVGEEVRRLPVGNAGKDDAIEVAENLVEGFAMLAALWAEVSSEFLPAARATEPGRFRRGIGSRRSSPRRRGPGGGTPRETCGTILRQT